MAGIALVVPVFKNLPGFAELMHSVDTHVIPIVIPNWDDNIGVSAGWNQGIQRSIDCGADVAIISNDDVKFYAGTIMKLAADVNNYKADLISACNRRDIPDVDHVEYDEHPDFACFAINPRHFVDKFGWFDEQFTPAYFEDNDMARRMIISGGVYLRRMDAAMYHAGSVTQNWGGSPYVSSQMFEKNRDYYISKWGGYPGEEIFERPFNVV